jgi:hypothetical protein
LASPSVDRYIVIGDIAIRFRSVTPFRVKGLNRLGMSVLLTVGQ